MIPLIDAHAILADLNSWGWRDFKIGIICGFTEGYICQVKRGRCAEMSHVRAVRLYNFWEEEALARGIQIPQYASPPIKIDPG